MESYKVVFMLLIFVGMHMFSVRAGTCTDNVRKSIYPFCKCKYGDVSCRNHGHNLTYIPKLDYVAGLYFTGNYLQNVSQHTFMNISTIELKSLSLANNRIQLIANDTFEYFHRLEYLDLGINNISANSFQALFPSLSKLDNLEYLGLESLSITNIPDNFFANITGTQLNVLKLRHNNITRVPSSVFTSFEYLEVLDLKFNSIVAFEMKEVMNNLHELNIGYNGIANFPIFCSSNGTSFIPAIRVLFIDYNRLTVINKNMFQCMKTLQKLDVSANQFHVLENDILQHMEQLSSLYVRWNEHMSLRILPFSFRSRSLTRLYISSYNLASYMFVSFDNTFNNSPNLRILNLQSISFAEMDLSDLESLFQSLIKLRFLSLYNGNIRTISRELFNKMPNLETLELGRNKVSSLNNAPFQNLRFLKSLKLGHNRIGEIEKGMLPLSQSRLKHLDLSNNPFICNCNISWFQSWLTHSHKHVSHYPRYYICAGPGSEKGKLLKDVRFTYRECHPFTPYEWAAMIGSPSLVAIVIVATILYRNRWNIKHYIYLVRKRRNYERIENNDFVYDAFVSYSQHDYVWVTGIMLPKLELEENYKLCVHDRDFTPGKYILDNIVTHLDMSRKAILIISNEFAISEWCRFELKLAQKRSIDDDADTVIVVLLEDLQARNVPKYMKVLLNTTTYIEWTTDQVGQQLFWNKLTTALRKPA